MFTPKAAVKLCFFFRPSVLEAELGMDGDCSLDSSIDGEAVKIAGSKAVAVEDKFVRFCRTRAWPLFNTLSDSNLVARFCFFFRQALGYSMRRCRMKAL